MRGAGPAGGGGLTMPLVEIEPARAGDAEAVVALVGAAGLPEDGVRELVPTLLVARADGRVAGSAGIEAYGRDALLRSVAVDPVLRGQGVGRRLAEAAVALAGRLGVERLYLLTETAAPFFARLGFGVVARAGVPAAVQASREFARLCPASAQAMMRDLRLTLRRATPADAAAIARVYNQGIEDRVATFETRLRTEADIRAWFDGRHPVVVVEDTGRVVAVAAASSYRPRACYAGVAEFGVYVARDARRRGAGRLAMVALADEAAAAGFWKLVSRVFVENAPSRALLASLGFREVGVYRRHARLDGVWRDVVIVERLVGEAAAPGIFSPDPSV